MVKYFTWTSADYFDPRYHNSCWCKVTIFSYDLIIALEIRGHPFMTSAKFLGF